MSDKGDMFVHRSDGSIVWGASAASFAHYNRPGANIVMEVVRCPSCGESWGAIRDATVARLECPDCEEMVPVERKEVTDGQG